MEYMRTSPSKSVCLKMPRDPSRSLEMERRECAEVAILEANMSMLWLHVSFGCSWEGNGGYVLHHPWKHTFQGENESINLA